MPVTPRSGVTLGSFSKKVLRAEAQQSPQTLKPVSPIRSLQHLPAWQSASHRQIVAHKPLKHVERGGHVSVMPELKQFPPSVEVGESKMQ
jgi:hypothetical protein